MLGYIVAGLALYFIVRFVVGFVIPIAKTTHHVRKTMQQRSAQQQNMAQQQPAEKSASKQSSGKAGEYIDFEEIKD